MSKLTLKTEGDTHVVCTRRFTAPPEAVYRAHLEPALIQKWLLGPDGWTMPVCLIEAKPGGKFRYEWKNAAKGQQFYLTGELLELQPYSKIVHVERMFLPEQTPDNHVETTFEPNGNGTLMTIRMTLPDEKTRGAMLSTGMQRGMEASYVRLEGMI
ncbi:MAG TPA: SRPBCC domain-containing protein [Dongiaceae bacterium]|nr:SRPBCC domain-containing protein [Dongiaceae bacterium]